MLICICAFSQEQRAYSFCGTIEYMAPEVVRGGSAGHDIVSFPTCFSIILHIFLSALAHMVRRTYFWSSLFHANLSIKIKFEQLRVLFGFELYFFLQFFDIDDYSPCEKLILSRLKLIASRCKCNYLLPTKCFSMLDLLLNLKIQLLYIQKKYGFFKVHFRLLKIFKA